MHTALILIDVQQSFKHRPYWNDAELPAFLERSNALIAGAAARGMPIVRVFHTDGPRAAANPFAPESGLIRPLDGLAPFDAAATFEKHRHSALVGTGLAAWLQGQGIRRLIIAGIRTEQCCETTARHASDEGWEVDYVTEATLTWAMRTPAGGELSAAQIRERTETVLAGRFATIATVEDALQRAS
ncbi:MAG: isochorismatase family protein [Burkholderiales bacterium]|nr:isochorismatase family protein [Burkholderiales bacterium]MDE1928572.1 isochorismatase family protein [Burkholderiales bacterium]MDE2158588.1 isochorismatase family protein [Burkholderiales bacterium]MDE2502418.1 isochorismatase family protein [Burkholderiales bacterium]